MKISKSLFLVGTLGATGAVSANAFNINEHDARITGRGGTATASDTDASSVVFNPGGIPVGEGVQVAINGSLYVAQGKYDNGQGGPETKTDSDPQVSPSIYATARVHKAIGVGVGFHLPFGLAVSWPDNHEQQTTIQDQSLRTYFITAGVGVNIGELAPAVKGLSIGGGVDIVPATVKLERAVVFGDTQGTAVLGGKATGIGGRAGIMFHPEAVPMLSLGVMWRSQVKLDFEGKGDFDIADPYRAQLPPDGDITTSITLPQSVHGGVAVRPIPQLEIEANVVWINWKKFKTLDLNFPGGVVSSIPENYENTVTYRLGVDYAINDAASVRAGFIYDPTPIPDTTQTAQLPDVDRVNVTVGGSYKFGDYAAHASLLWVTPRERDTNDKMYEPVYKGTYGVQALVASLMFTGHFDVLAGNSEPAGTDPNATVTQR